MYSTKEDLAFIEFALKDETRIYNTTYTYHLDGLTLDFFKDTVRIESESILTETDYSYLGYETIEETPHTLHLEYND